MRVQTNSSRLASIYLLIGTFCLCLATAARAQTPAPAPTQQPAAATSDTDADADITAVDRLHNTVAQNTQEAWDKLTTALQDAKHPDSRIQGLAALGTLGVNDRGAKLIVTAMKDPDLDVRTAAVLAAGQTKNRTLIPNLRTMLDDKEPQVVFAAATTLWKLNDHTGEDILLAVIDGDRKATAGLKDSTMHTMSKDLHSPATLARIGALQGASMLLGPFGIGITAYEYMRKNGGDSSRVLAIEQVSQQKTAPIRTSLIAALADKDPAVRAAAAKALGSYREKVVSNALLKAFDDSKAPVRLTAAAAYINSSQQSPQRTPTAAK